MEAANKDEAILVLLGKLALVYWRPDFSPGQAKQLYSQYLDDLRDYAMTDITEAVGKYRRDPENKFFPVPGQLRGIIETIPAWEVTNKSKWIGERLRAGQREMLDAVAATRKRLALASPERKAIQVVRQE